MSRLKPITEYTQEELLELLQDNPDKITAFEYDNDLLEFLSVFGIKSGPNKVQTRLIYRLYSKWSRNPLSMQKLALELSLVLPRENNILTINHKKEFFLEKIIKKNMDKTKRKPWLRHFQKFIDKYQLKSGRFYVKDIVLYNIYDKWTYKNSNKNPLSLFQFLKFCRLFFNKPRSKMIRSHEWFALSSNIKEILTPDLINLMKQK